MMIHLHLILLMSCVLVLLNGGHVTAYRYAGCFVTASSGGVLPGLRDKTAIRAPRVSAEQCVASCIVERYAYAMITNGVRCNCGTGMTMSGLKTNLSPETCTRPRQGRRRRHGVRVAVYGLQDNACAACSTGRVCENNACRARAWTGCSETEDCLRGLVCAQRKCRPKCHSNGCRNGGSCFRTSFRRGGTRCDCASGFYGRLCEKRQRCRCRNGGSCVRDRGRNVRCACADAFHGQWCQDARLVPENPCKASPCRNLGTCMTAENDNYRCLCEPGFEGSHCERRVTPNPCKSSPCRNHDICMSYDDGSQYRCIPDDNTSGNDEDGNNDGDGGSNGGDADTATSEPDPCMSNPCRNQGACASSQDGTQFRCACKAGFWGKTCEDTGAPGPCNPNPCANGASCETLGNGSYACHCTCGFRGKHCQCSKGSNVCQHVTYTTLSDPWRSVDLPKGEHCDAGLSGWVRFCLDDVNAAIATTCVRESSCGVTIPIWVDLQGQFLPAMGEEREVAACAASEGDCCARKESVTVRNCGAFLLYKVSGSNDSNGNTASNSSNGRKGSNSSNGVCRSRSGYVGYCTEPKVKQMSRR